MRVLRALLLTLLVVGLLGASAYGAGRVLRDRDERAAASDTGAVLVAPSSSTTSTTTCGRADPDRTDRPTTDPEPTFDTLARGDRGVRVRELQQRLYQLSWLPETTTGVVDDATVAAVRGFQAKRHLETTGSRGRGHVAAAGADDRSSPRTTSSSTSSSPARRSSRGATRARTSATCRPGSSRSRGCSATSPATYDDETVKAVRGFQAKREIPVTGEVDQRTLDRLHAMTTTPTREAMFNLGPQAGALDARCRTGRVICVDKTSSTLRWVVDGKVQLTVEARFGASTTPTREGLFHVYYKDADHVSRLYGSSMPYAMFFSGGQAVHYSSDFAAVGYAGASHGCVNVRDYDAVAWLFDQVQVGDKVVVYWS